MRRPEFQPGAARCRGCALLAAVLSVCAWGGASGQATAFGFRAADNRLRARAFGAPRSTTAAGASAAGAASPALEDSSTRGDGWLFGQREPATRWHDGRVVGHFGYRPLTLAGCLVCLLVALAATGALAALPAGPWTRAARRLCAGGLGLCLLPASAWLAGSAWLLSWLLRLLAVTRTAPALLRTEQALPSRWSTTRPILPGGAAVHLLRWPGPGEADGREPSEGTGAKAGGVPPVTVVCFHGFGASSLSWEDLLPSLPEALAPCRAVLCPDQMGFGLTERVPLPLGAPKALGAPVRGLAGRSARQAARDLEPDQAYSLPGNAVLASALAEAELEGKGPARAPEELVVMGHSMGAIAAAAFAAEESSRRPVTLILESPAFLGGPAQGPAKTERKLLGWGRRKLLAGLGATARAFLLLPGIVYNRAFWENGLGAAAFSKAALGEEKFSRQVLKYRWPSLFEGWALGLANFVVARSLRGLEEDQEVLRDLVSAYKVGGDKGPRS